MNTTKHPVLPASKSDLRSIIFFGVARGGSSIFNTIIRQIALKAGMKDLDILGTYYSQGVRISDIDPAITDDLFVKNGVYYGPFRELPPKLFKFNLDGYTKILVVRDPRDCLTSHYFAMKNIHTKFKAGVPVEKMQKGREINQTIDEYVIEKTMDYIKVFNKYINFVKRNSDIIIYKYEDIISNYKNWIYDVTQQCGISLTAEQISEVYTVGNFDVKKEDEFQHKRQVTPGDHIRKLKSETIDELNKIMNKQLGFFDYYRSIRTIGAHNFSQGSNGTADKIDSIELAAMQSQIDKLQKNVNDLLAANHNRIKEIQVINSKIKS